MQLPPPKALSVAPIRAAADWLGRDSLTTPMLAVPAKSNGMSALPDGPVSPLSFADWLKLPFVHHARNRPVTTVRCRGPPCDKEPLVHLLFCKTASRSVRIDTELL